MSLQVYANPEDCSAFGPQGAGKVKPNYGNELVERARRYVAQSPYDSHDVMPYVMSLLSGALARKSLWPISTPSLMVFCWSFSLYLVVPSLLNLQHLQLCVVISRVVFAVCRNHANDLENIPMFLLAALAYVAINPSLGVALLHFRIFTVSRCIHTFAYQVMTSRTHTYTPSPTR